MKSKIFYIATGILLGYLVFANPLHLFKGQPETGATQERVEAKKQLWTCGMHPQVIQDHPGSCPICGMDLVPVREAEEVRPHTHEAESALYTCPMHPDILQSEPGACPICGMDLVPVKKDATEKATISKGKGKILFYRNPMDPTITSPVPRKDDMGMDYVPVYENEAEKAASGGTGVTIDPTVVQNMNVVSEKTQRRDITRAIRTVGYLDYDEEGIVTVTTKYKGWIEKSHVNTIGQPVKKGQPLFEIYAPALVQTEKELLSAAAYAGKMASASDRARSGARALVDAAIERLGYWDIGREQIDTILKTGKVLRTLTLTSPVSGLVMQQMGGLEGMEVQPGMNLIRIADISDLWLDVEIYENQLPWIHVKSPAMITLSYFPGETFRGKVRYVEPSVSVKTRTIRATLRVPNPGGKLKVGMYATVLFEPVVAKKAVVVPSQAVIRTGERSLVIVAEGEGRFSPREVILGPEGDDIVQIKQGLREGEEVVTSAQFLIDSESNLKEAIRKMIEAKRQSKGGGSHVE